MADKIIIPVKLKLDEIESQLNKIQDKIVSSKLGSKLSGEMTRGVENIKKQLASVQNSLPGEGASATKIQNYANKIIRLSDNIDKLSTKFKELDVSDDLLFESSGKLKGLAESWKEATKTVEEYKNKITEASNVNIVEGSGVKGTAQKTQSAMKKAALSGSSTELDRAYNEGRQVIEAKMAAANPEMAALQQQQLDALEATYQRLNPLVMQNGQALENQEQAFQKVSAAVGQAKGETQAFANETANDLDKVREQADGAAGATKKLAQEAEKAGSASRNVDMLGSRIEYMFSSFAIFMKVKQIIKGVIDDFKELDKQFNDIAIVSQYSTKEMWESFSTVNKMAQEYGVTTKNVLEVQNLYYHQGKKMAEVNELTAETLKLAKITGMGYEDATNKMTAALNAYSIAAEDAARVTDTVAALSANAATSSEELMTALTKTASIAANAGMSLENTEIFLTKMIETTREAPENLGTALKTITARFGEVKQEIDGEEIDLIDVNKVDTALKSVGLSLLDTGGQMKDLDTVFMELSAKWDDLDRNTQRYIATQAAGSRQQSRFIAMMSDYKRTMELADVAARSKGTGDLQLAKAQESLETATNRLKASWQELMQTFIKSGMISKVYDILNSILKILTSTNPVVKAVSIAFGGLLTKYVLINGVIKKAITWHKLMIGAISAEEAAQKMQSASITHALKTRIKMGKTMKEYIAARKALNTSEVTGKGIQDSLTAAQEKEMTAILAKTGMNKQEIQDSVTKTNAILAEAAARDKDAQASDREALASIIEEAATDGTITSKEKEAMMTVLTTTEKETETKSREKHTATLILEKLHIDATNMSLGVQIALLGAIAVAIAAVIAVAIVLIAINSKYNKTVTDTSDAIDQLNEAQQEYNDSVSKLKDFKSNVKIVEEYQQAILLTTEQQEELTNAMNAIADKYPELIDYYDEAGNAVLKESDALHSKIDILEEESKKLAQNTLELEKNNAERGVVATSAKDNTKKTMQDLLSGAAITETDPKAAAKEYYRATMGYTEEAATESMRQALKEQGSAAIVGSGGLFAGSVGIEALGTEAIIKLGLSDEVMNAYSEIISSDNERYEKLFEGLINGTGLVQGNTDVFFGSKMSEEDYKKLQMSEEDLTTDTGLLKALKDIYGEETALEMFGETTTIPEELRNAILEDLASQREGLIQAYRDGLYNLFDIDESDIGLEGEQKGKWADLLKNAIGQGFEDEQSAYDYVAGLTEDERKEIEDAMEYSTVKIEEFLSEDGTIDLSGYVNNLDVPEDVKAAMLKYYEETFGLTDEQIQKTVDALGLDAEKLKKLNIEQLKARTAIRENILATQTGEDKEEKTALYMKNLNDILGDNAQAWNAAAKAADGTVSGYSNAIKGMVRAGLSAEDTTQAIVDLAGGFDNLPFNDVTEAFKDLTDEMENFQKAADALGNLKKGEGSLEDYEALVQQITNMYSGGELVQAVNDLQNAMYVSSDGSLGLDPSKARSFMQEILSGEKSILQVKAELAKISAKEAENRFNELLTEYKLTDATLETAQAELIKMAAAKELTEEQTNQLIQLQNEWANASLSSLMYSNAGRTATQVTKNLGDALEKAAEHAKNLRDALKDLYDWMLDLDRFSNLDAVRDRIEREFSNLEFDINFTTNSDKVAKDYTQMLGNLGAQMASAMAGKQGAEKNLKAITDSINKNFSKYLSIDASGALIYNQKEIENLQKRIADSKKLGADATEEDEKNAEAYTELLENEYDNIEKIASAYNNVLKKTDDYEDALQDVLEKYEEIKNEMLQNVVDLQDKIIEVIQEREDKEVEKTREKYELIKEEDQRYLDNVQKMVDKERQIRDQARADEDIKKKERKLAMMKMDTSGVYAGDIASLEEELQQDYQDREDNTVDQMIKDMQDFYNTQHETYDRQIEFMENTLEAHRETMAYYYELYEQIANGTVDDIVAYLKQNSEEYMTASAEKKKLLEQEWATLAARGTGSAKALKKGITNNVIAALEQAKTSTEELDDMVGEFATNANGHFNGVNATISNLNATMSTLISLVGTSLVSAYNAMETAANNAYTAAVNANNAAGGDGGTGNNSDDISDDGARYVTGSHIVMDSASINGDIVDMETGNKEWQYTGTTKKYVDHDDNNKEYVMKQVKNSKGETGWIFDMPATTTTPPNPTEPTTISFYSQDGGDTVTYTREQLATRPFVYIRDVAGGKAIEVMNVSTKSHWAVNKETAKKMGLKLYDTSQQVAMSEEDKKKVKKEKTPVGYDKTGYYYFDDRYMYYTLTQNKWKRKQYAKGGLVDYTGPAWVDGTKSNPEAFLSATDVRNIASLTDILSSIFKPFKLSSIYGTNNSDSDTSNATYYIEVNVDGIASDYDVDMAIDRIENRIKSAAQYRNVNVLKKSN